MARAAASALRALLEPAPGRLEFAVRTALACMLTAALTALYRIPEAALPVYLVFFINRPDRGSTLRLAAALPLVALIVITLLLGLARGVVDSAPLRVAAIAASSVVLLWLASASRLQPIAGTVALVVAYGLDLLGSVPLGDAATRGLLYGLLFVILPAVACAVLALPLAPSPQRMVQRSVAARLRAAADALRAGRGNAALRRLGGTLQLQAWLGMLQLGTPAADLAAWRGAAVSSGALLETVGLMVRDAHSLPDAQTRAELVTLLEAMAQTVDAGSWPLDVAPPLAAAEGLRGALLRALHDQLAGFADAVPAPPKPRASLLRSDALSNPVHLRYALKTSAAAVGCYLLYSVLDWPGIHTCFITCYIVSLGTVAESVEKLSLRLAGCMAGALLGTRALLLALPQITTLGAWLALIGSGVLLGAWIAAGSERIAYAGFQLAFAFVLCVVQGSGPGFDLVVARDRIIGILIGNLVAYAVATTIWPQSVRARIDELFDQALHLLAQLRRTPEAHARRALAARLIDLDHALIDAFALLRYEPDAVRPPLAWRRSAMRAARAIARLGPALLLCGEAPGAAADALAARARGTLHAALQALRACDGACDATA